jgi:tRNA pseudouridine32 synthase/23S rRNA pseudouridine746 synthase
VRRAARPAPLPPRDGLGPARIRLRGAPEGSSGGGTTRWRGTTGEMIPATEEMVSVLAELTARFGAAAVVKVSAGEVVDADGVVVDNTTVLPAGASVYLYRELPDEVPVPFGIPVIHRDDDIVVVDKPHFLATMPRGGHVAQTALVRLRRELDLPELSPAHRLDRLTAGLLMFTTRRDLRGRYQTLFSRRMVHKTYKARAAADVQVALPTVLRSRIVKYRGRLQAVEEPGEPNAETLIERAGPGLYRLTPRTGRTHQLRLHMASLGLPILGDPLYPRVVDVAPEDFSAPLQLLADSLEFDDPITGRRRRFVSSRTLDA